MELKRHDTMEAIADWLEQAYLENDKITAVEAYCMAINAYELGAATREVPVADDYADMIVTANAPFIQRRSKPRGDVARGLVDAAMAGGDVREVD